MPCLTACTTPIFKSGKMFMINRRYAVFSTVSQICVCNKRSSEVIEDQDQCVVGILGMSMQVMTVTTEVFLTTCQKGIHSVFCIIYIRGMLICMLFGLWLHISE